MKIICLILFLTLFIFTSCEKTKKNELQNGIFNSAFSPALKHEILKMIELKGNKVYNEKVCSVVILEDITRDRACTAVISLTNSIVVQKITRFIPPSDSVLLQSKFDKIFNGYTFIGDELIGCSLVSGFCSDSLVNKQKLNLIGDSIPGYPNVLNSDISLMNDDSPIRVYRIISKDSLQLIKSAFISQDPPRQPGLVERFVKWFLD